MWATCSSEIMLHLGKRIDPAPPASANLAHDPAAVRQGEDFRCGSGLGGSRSLRRDQVYTGRGAQGRFIRHAGALTLAVVALTVAMIVSSPGGLLVAAVRLAALPTERFLPAVGATITLATIAVTAEIEHRPTGREVTKALAENRGTSSRHRFREAAVDNRHRSWQDDSRERTWRSLIGAPNEKPRLLQQPGFSSVSLREIILPNPTLPASACGDDAQSRNRLRR